MKYEKWISWDHGLYQLAFEQLQNDIANADWDEAAWKLTYILKWLLDAEDEAAWKLAYILKWHLEKVRPRPCVTGHDGDDPGVDGPVLPCDPVQAEEAVRRPPCPPRLEGEVEMKYEKWISWDHGLYQLAFEQLQNDIANADWDEAAWKLTYILKWHLEKARGGR